MVPWPPLLGLCQRASKQDRPLTHPHPFATTEKIVRLAFELVESIMSKHFKLIADSFFVECVNCLIAFAKAQHFKDIR